MRSSRVDEIEPSGWGLAECMVTESACQCQSRNSPGFDPSILRRSGIWGTADEALLNKVHTNRPIWLLLQVEWLAWIEMPKKFFKKKRSSLTKTEIYGHPNFCGHLLLLSRNFSRQAISHGANREKVLVMSDIEVFACEFVTVLHWLDFKSGVLAVDQTAV
jgi:hypothetical protein